MSHKDNFTDLIEGLPQESEPQEPSQQVMDSDGDMITLGE
jgi:hypothetical protein